MAILSPLVGSVIESRRPEIAALTLKHQIGVMRRVLTPILVFPGQCLIP
jgi:hypothetical protein